MPSLKANLHASKKKIFDFIKTNLHPAALIFIPFLGGQTLPPERGWAKLIIVALQLSARASEEIVVVIFLLGAKNGKLFPKFNLPPPLNAQ